MPNGNDVPLQGMPEGMPMPSGEWRYTNRFVTALQVAAVMHAAQVRKGSSVPYVTHLLGTCAIALDHGATEDEAIAALLHDSLEDVQPTEFARATVAWFGPEVLHIVEACTDGTPGPDGHKTEWYARKTAYLAHLGEACGPVLLVSASDKLHNARSVVADLRTVGDEVWGRFKKGRQGTLWHYRSLVAAFRANPAHIPALIDELERTVAEMERHGGTVG